jgi:hypothetical protein
MNDLSVDILPDGLLDLAICLYSADHGMVDLLYIVNY